MSTDDALRERLLERIGKPMGSGGPTAAPDPVNLPMIHHWVDAFDDRNPVYEDPAAAAAAGFGGLVAPIAMLQTWTMPRPRIEGIRERGGSPGDMDPDTPVSVLAAAGFRGTLATNSILEFDRYLHLGEQIDPLAEPCWQPRKTPRGVPTPAPSLESRQQLRIANSNCALPPGFLHSPLHARWPR